LKSRKRISSECLWRTDLRLMQRTLLEQNHPELYNQSWNAIRRGKVWVVLRRSSFGMHQLQICLCWLILHAPYSFQPPRRRITPKKNAPCNSALMCNVKPPRTADEALLVHRDECWSSNFDFRCLIRQSSPT
jgi:hypothetical protein